MSPKPKTNEEFPARDAEGTPTEGGEDIDEHLRRE